MSNPSIEKYGWTAVPRKLSTLLSQSQASSSPAKPISVSSISLPSTPLANAVLEYAQNELPVETFNHSMRVFYYGQAILYQAFPNWSTPTFNETYLLTCLLHDIGTTLTNLKSTLLSFEFHGGLIVLDLLNTLSAPKDQAENVAEAVIRHQDLGDTGTITRIGALVQLATVFDNMGMNPELVHKETIEDVVGKWPRRGWSRCFAETILREKGLKPWCHTTHLGGESGTEFEDGVRGNKLMVPYDDLQ